jgi:hypothetical protein
MIRTAIEHKDNFTFDWIYNLRMYTIKICIVRI